jgi:intracellular multiplication protein IcmB
MKTIATSFLQNVESVMAWLSSHALGADFPSYCQLETAIGMDPDSSRAKQMAAVDPKGARPYILITRDCAMLTMLELTGSMDIVGDVEFERITEELRRSMTSYCQRAGHSFEFSFERDPDVVRAKIRAMMKPTYDTCERVGLDLTDMLDARVERVASLCSHESCYLLLYTHLSAMAPDEFKREMESHKQNIKEHAIQPMVDAQSPTAIMKGILHRHETFVDAIERDCRYAKLHVERMSTHESARAIRMSYDRRRTDARWKPALPGDRYTPRKSVNGSLGDLYLPKFSEQMCSGRIETDGEFVNINGEYHGAAYMDLGPQEVHDFMMLFDRVGRDLPWRIRFTIEPGGLEASKFKSFAVSIFGFLGSTNKSIKRSFDAIQHAQDEGECHVSVRITAATWGPDKKTCQERLSSLVAAMQGWGVAQISTDVGDPVAGLTSTIPGFSDKSIAPKLVPPLRHIVRMLPIQRASSPWHAGGSIMLRTLDGKVYPFQPNSSLQTAWIDLIWAIMGSGKSVWLNTLNLGAILSPGLRRLPLITILDVGVSSSGLIDLIRNALPTERQNEALYIRLRNESEFAINPCDTLPGCRKPTGFDREFLISLLTSLATPVGSQTPYANAPELAGMLVDEVYAKYSDPSSQKRYEATIDAAVDAALEKIGFQADEYTSWWHVTDELTKSGMTRESRLAQRFAVPVLADFVEACGSDRIRSIFEPSETSKAMTDMGMSLLDAMRMAINTALRDFSIIASHTRFELNDLSRIIALDLEEVTRGSGPDGERRAEIMFIFARQIAARQYYLPEDISDLAPSLYHDSHRKKYEDIKDEMKGLCVDELHRTGGKKSFRRLLSMDRREGRKHGIRVSLASQFMGDFDSDGEPITESAFSAYIMNAGTADSRRKAQELFGLSDSAVAALERDVRGAGRFLVWHQTKTGVVTQILHNAPGAIELWAFSTTAPDVALRKRMYKRASPAVARRILAREFPSGSAQTYLEARRADQGAREVENVIDKVADELLVKYRDEFHLERAA